VQSEEQPLSDRLTMVKQLKSDGKAVEKRLEEDNREVDNRE
jgi:hypothetical protein